VGWWLKMPNAGHTRQQLPRDTLQSKIAGKSCRHGTGIV